MRVKASGERNGSLDVFYCRKIFTEFLNCVPIFAAPLVLLSICRD